MLAGMALATLFVTMPFVARELIPILESMDMSQEEAARTLGANDLEVLLLGHSNVELLLRWRWLVRHRSCWEFLGRKVLAMSGLCTWRDQEIMLLAPLAVSDLHTLV